MVKQDELRNKLKQTRIRLGMSQQDLANLAGVTRQTISGVESGQYAPSTTIALRLAKALGCQVEDLFWLEAEVFKEKWVNLKYKPFPWYVRLDMGKLFLMED